jgi:hypothetical protein
MAINKNDVALEINPDALLTQTVSFPLLFVFRSTQLPLSRVGTIKIDIHPTES